ncbi:hypothetical protein FHS86_000677 [Roseimarinus sediminis]
MEDKRQKMEKWYQVSRIKTNPVEIFSFVEFHGASNKKWTQVLRYSNKQYPIRQSTQKLRL